VNQTHVPKVSVLMAVHNAEKHLRPAVQSILDQSLADFEFLVVDDASTDRSRDILKSFHDDRIRLIQNVIHQGASSARNQGLGLARAEYVAILDSDDVAHLDRLAIQSAFLDKHPDVCLVGGTYEIIDELGRTKGIQQVPTDAWTIRWKLLFGNPLGHSTVMYRRSAVLAAGAYDPTLSFAEDYDLWIRLAPHHKFFQQELPLTSYRIHGESTTYQTPEITREQVVAGIVAKAIGQLVGHPIDPKTAYIVARDVGGHEADPRDLSSASALVDKCLRCLIACADVSPAERHLLVSAASEDLLRIAAKYPGRNHRAEWAALGLMARHDPVCLFTRRCLRTVVRAMLPEKARRAIRRAKRVARRRHSQLQAGNCMVGSRSSRITTLEERVQ
jgi:hypothetical protein